jgi:peptidyl-dipeptidase Dcp
MKTLTALAGAATLLASPAFAADMNDATTTAASNPLLAPWTGPYGGVPPFDKARTE